MAIETSKKLIYSFLVVGEVFFVRKTMNLLLFLDKHNPILSSILKTKRADHRDMENSKLYSLLTSLDKYEQNSCRKYIVSPYFNKNDNLVILYDSLIDHVNSARSKDLEKEWLWDKLNPSEAYNDVRFRKYCSDLLKLIEGFLAQQIYENDPLRRATFLIEAVGKRKISKLVNSTLSTARRISDKSDLRSAKFYFHQYQIEKNYYDLLEFEANRFVKSNIEETAKYLDHFYIAEKLRMYCAVLNQRSLISQEYQLLLIEEILSYLKELDLEDIPPPIALYYQVVLTTIDSENLDHYFKLKSLLQEHGLKFPKQEALQLYYSAINYCIRRINKSDQKFLEESFQLYNELIENEIIFINDELSPWDFKNIIVLALRLGKYQWTEGFILNYNHKLPEVSRENAVTYNLAQLYFYQKRYDKVIEQLQNVEYEDVSYNLNSKSMLIATYYEMDEIEPLYSLFESFRAYLNRHKDISNERRKNYSNLIRITKKLTKLSPGDEKALEKIKAEMIQTKNIASANWLREKISELEGV